jgi:hypothetical protein
VITSDTADQIEQLGLAIFNPHTEAGSGNHSTGLQAADPLIDAQLASLIGPVMLAIDGRTLAQGFKYTLNVTNALQLRAKHWYLRGVEELDATSFWPCSTAMEFIPTAGTVLGGTSSFGYSIGLSTCACICKTWATIIRMWLAGNYPLAVTQPQ